MPCTVTKEEALAYEREANKANLGKSLTDAEIATEAACQMGKLLREHDLVDKASPFVQKWIARHEASDRAAEAAAKSEREAIELKRKALSKLSKAEREALGLE